MLYYLYFPPPPLLDPLGECDWEALSHPISHPQTGRSFLHRLRFGCSLGVERSERFRFSVPAVPLWKGVHLFFNTVLTGTVPVPVPVGSRKTAVPVPRSVPGKTVPTVPFSGSGSVPEPPCQFYSSHLQWLVPPQTSLSICCNVGDFNLPTSDVTRHVPHKFKGKKPQTA